MLHNRDSYWLTLNIKENFRFNRCILYAKPFKTFLVRLHRAIAKAKKIKETIRKDPKCKRQNIKENVFPIAIAQCKWALSCSSQKKCLWKLRQAPVIWNWHEPLFPSLQRTTNDLQSRSAVHSFCTHCSFRFWSRKIPFYSVRCSYRRSPNWIHRD